MQPLNFCTAATEQSDTSKRENAGPKKDLVSGGGIFLRIMPLQSCSTLGGFSCKI